MYILCVISFSAGVGAIAYRYADKYFLLFLFVSKIIAT